LGTTLFLPEAGRSIRWQIFLNTSWGRLYQTIPFKSLAELLPTKKTKSGAIPRFTYEGLIALQVLKHQMQTSDDNVIKHLNGNWELQYFCGIELKQGERIRDGDILVRSRKFLGAHLDLPQFDKVLIKEWLPKMEQTQSNLADATCIETDMRYPTDVKLLWECIDFLKDQLHCICRAVKMPMVRSKFKEVKKAVQSYFRRKKKSHKLRKRLKRRLLYLLNKLLRFTPSVIANWKLSAFLFEKTPFKPSFFKKLSIIKKVHYQQKIMFDRGKKSIKNRIVSLAKDYIRPIVRGKENKRVEFGMKLHVMQVDGINFIEHGNFEAFHEGVRMKQTIWKHRRYFGKCLHFGGDKLYANNANRKFCTQQGIQTCFIPKGRKSKEENQKSKLRKLIGKERATRLEGSFGTIKNHYHLRRVKARTKLTEIVWIYFGQLTANAVLMSKRINAPPK